MALAFQRATKRQLKARIALFGPSGSGKTYTALVLASALGPKVAVVDTERGSASKYADEFVFDVLELSTFHPRLYIEAIQAAAQAGYDVLVIDSLSHAWMGKDGALELVDRNAAKYKGNSYAAWRDVTPLHNELVDAILAAPMHIVATMRSKTAYIQTKDDKDKTVIRKVGMEPIQREGVEYEFDVVGEMDTDHNLIITKTRCKALDEAVINCPGPDLAEKIKAWLSGGQSDGQELEVCPAVDLPQANAALPQAHAAPPAAATSRHTDVPPKPLDAATKPQMAKISKLRDELGIDEDMLRRLAHDQTGKEHLSELTKKEASAFIQYLIELQHGTMQQEIPAAG